MKAPLCKDCDKRHWSDCSTVADEKTMAVQRVYDWREQNREKYNTYQRRLMRERRANHI